jgi:hypothetical protein
LPIVSDLAFWIRTITATGNVVKALLHVAAQRLGFTDQEYHHILIERTGFLSSGDPNFSDEELGRGGEILIPLLKPNRHRLRRYENKEMI